ncbi:MAG: hypothetical protein LUG66_07485 [Clostridiales bacterium]|nr:hypothetical protein [Clostridiales bacterium]
MINKSKEDIIQNLKDAGCGDETISKFMENINKGYTEEGTDILNRHRRTLLDKLHKNQKQIDCLDYLMYTMKK